jgi:hypothetical protein
MASALLTGRGGLIFGSAGDAPGGQGGGNLDTTFAGMATMLAAAAAVLADRCAQLSVRRRDGGGIGAGDQASK